MAEYLASIYGTEKDKVNCSFYYKIGACRHGQRCSRIHNKPNFSQTVLLQNFYVNPQNYTKSANSFQLNQMMSDQDIQEHYDNFYEDVFVESEDKYGEIEEMYVCDNLGDHLMGNVYIKFRREEAAEKAVTDLNNRWFNKRPIYAELSPVTDFHEASCREYDVGECARAGFCNFLHVKPISRELRKYLYGSRPSVSNQRQRQRQRQRSVSLGRSSSSSRSTSSSPRRSRSWSPYQVKDRDVRKRTRSNSRSRSSSRENGRRRRYYD